MENRRAGRLYVASVRRAVCCTRRGRAISAFRAKVCTRHGTADDRTQLYLCAALRGMCGSCGEMCAQCCAPACGVGVDANNLSLSSTTLPLSLRRITTQQETSHKSYVKSWHLREDLAPGQVLT